MLASLQPIAEPRPLREGTLRELLGTGAVSAVRLVGGKGGFALTIHCAGIDRTLGSSRGEVRQFASLNTAVDFLRRLGIELFEVDSRSYQPGRTRKPRPDRA